MFGEQLLVAPCLKPGGRVEPYLPSGTWLRFPGGESYDGGQNQPLTLALNAVAVFIRCGEKIPLGPAVQTTDALGSAPIIEKYWPAGAS